MRARLSELIEENKRLHEELKSSVLQEIMGDDKEIHKVLHKIEEIKSDQFDIGVNGILL